MHDNNRLTHGNILNALIKLAIPIMGTSFIQMAYSMMDMIWIGRMGSDEVAAVGTAGFFTWLAMAFVLIPKIGAEVGVAQSIGKDDINAAREYVLYTIQMSIILSILYGAFIILTRSRLIGFFNLGDPKVEKMAMDYLLIVFLFIIFFFINPMFTGIFNGYGNSKTPFKINTIGLILNIVLDPVLIFGLGPFPAMGVRGAAVATVFSQIVVTCIFIVVIRQFYQLFYGFNLFKKMDIKYLKSIIKLGFPFALQEGLFSIFAMIIARIIAKWGPIPIAVQKIGSQIESISWMTAEGFSTAISTFIGQNYGAKKWDRIYKGYYTAVKMVGTVGVFATILLIFGAESIFSFFIPNDKETLKQGIIYLQILGVSQFFMCMEIGTAGAFRGLGKTIPPTLVGIIFTGLRIPMALLLSNENLLGLNGVWWSISISSVMKGIILTTWFIIYLKKNSHLYINRV